MIDEPRPTMTEDPPVQPPRRRLRRRGEDDRVIAGVAGGIADRFDLSTALVRGVFGAAAAVFALLALRAVIGDAPLRLLSEFGLGRLGGLERLFVLFAWFGVLTYFVLWGVIPAEDLPDSAGQRAARRAPRLARHLRTWLGVVLIVAGVGFVGDELSLWDDGFVLAAILIALGVMLYRRDQQVVEETFGTPMEPAAATPRPEAPAAPPDPSVEPIVPRPVRSPRERSPLGWIALGVALLAVGAAAIGVNLGIGHLTLQQYPAIALLVLSIGMLVGAFAGRARWLSVVAVMIVPFLLAASLIHVPLEGGYGDIYVRARTPGDVAGSYARVAGGLFFDLTGLQGDDGRFFTSVTTGVGDVSVLVPFDAHVVLSAEVGAGEIWIGARNEEGAEIAVSDVRWEPKYGDGVTFEISAAVGIGTVTIDPGRPDEAGEAAARARAAARRARGGGGVKPHRFDPLSFVLGLTFLVVALAFLGGERSVADIGEVWLWALPVSAIGLLIVTYGVRRALRRDATSDAASDVVEVDAEQATPSLRERFGRVDDEV